MDITLDDKFDDEWPHTGRRLSRD